MEAEAVTTLALPRRRRVRLRRGGQSG